MTDAELPDGWEPAGPLYLKSDPRGTYTVALAFSYNNQWYACKLENRKQFDLAVLHGTDAGLPGFDTAVAAMVWYELNH